MPTDLAVLFSPKNVLFFIVIMTRLSGMMVSAPLFSTYPIPIMLKTWIVAVIAFIIFPMVSANINALNLNSIPELAFVLILEFAIGFLIGFLANIIFIGLQLAGEIISLQMGFTISNVLDPVTGTSAPLIGQFYLYFASFLFLALNAHLVLFSAVYQSFISIPPGFSVPIDGAILHTVLKLSTQIFHIAFGLIFPIFGILFAAEVLLGFISKLMPQMNVFVVSIPIKLYLGVTLMIAFLIPCKDFIVTSITNHSHAILNLFLGG